MASRVDAESGQAIAGQVLLAELSRMIEAKPTHDVVRESPVLEEEAAKRGFTNLTEQDKEEISTWIDLATLDVEVRFV